ncbi:FMRFamide receptor [Lepeophtheirus salmonis]|nr:FMRFamide receptor-like [Lepeophtheirus salmonis]
MENNFIPIRLNNLSYLGYEDTDCPTSDQASEYLINQVKFWVEGVSLSLVAIIGAIGNILSIIVLSHPDLRNSFNLLLIGLSIFDSIYVFVSFLEALRKSFGIVSNVHLQLYPHFIYPSQMISLTGSVFLIISISFERYISVHHPLDYNQAMNDCSATYRRLWKFLIPAIIFSFMFNLPKFFETRVISIPGNSTTLKIGVTKMRLSPAYSTYITLSEFFVLGVIPVLLLVYFNGKIYRDIKEREQRLRRPERNAKVVSHSCFGKQGPSHSPPFLEQDNIPSRTPVQSRVVTISNNVRRRSTEDKMARLFMTIVFMFLICHIPRITLNFYEMFTLKTALKCADRQLPTISVWVEIMMSVSNFILVVNSSVNIIIYGAFNIQFRKAAKKRWAKLVMLTPFHI